MTVCRCANYLLLAFLACIVVPVAVADDHLLYEIDGSAYYVWSVGPNGVNDNRLGDDMVYIPGAVVGRPEDPAGPMGEQTRGNLQKIGNAIASYYIDNNYFPPAPLDQEYSPPGSPTLTEPVAYIVRSGRDSNYGYDSAVVGALDRMRQVAVGLNAYYVDNNDWPASLGDLLAPISYLSSLPDDPFRGGGTFDYSQGSTEPYCVLWSLGPDGDDDLTPIPSLAPNNLADLVSYVQAREYDASNPPNGDLVYISADDFGYDPLDDPYTATAVVTTGGPYLHYEISGSTVHLWSVGPNGVNDNRLGDDMVYIPGAVVGRPEDPPGPIAEETRRNLQEVGAGLEPFYVDNNHYPLPPLDQEYSAPGPATLFEPVGYVRSRSGRLDSNYGYHPTVVEAKDSMREIVVALNAYYVDNNDWPAALADLLSPVVYLSSLPDDPFRGSGTFQYSHGSTEPYCILWSVGRDGDDDLSPIPSLAPNDLAALVDHVQAREYDASGSSDGDIVFTSADAFGYDVLKDPYADTATTAVGPSWHQYR